MNVSRDRPARYQESWRLTIRFLLVGTLNYVAGNLIFTFYWWAFHHKLAYFLIALLTMLSTSLFSYSTHTFGTLKSRRFEKTDLGIYTFIQGIGLVSSVILVPRVSSIFEVHLLLVQYIWSAIYSVMGILLLKMLVNMRNRRKILNH